MSHKWKSLLLNNNNNKKKNTRFDFYNIHRNIRFHMHIYVYIYIVSQNWNFLVFVESANLWKWKTCEIALAHRSIHSSKLDHPYQMVQLIIQPIMPFGFIFMFHIVSMWDVNSTSTRQWHSKTTIYHILLWLHCFFFFKH